MGILGFAVLASWTSAAGPSGLGILPDRRVDPSQILPMQLVAPEFRSSVEETIRSSSFRHRGPAETFPCNPRLYLSLLNDPALTLSLWKDLNESPAELYYDGPGHYQGTDGNGTTASWHYVLQSPTLHAMLCHISYRSPSGTARLEGRLVLVVRTEYYKESTGEPWIQHSVEAFVKIDSRGWRAVAQTVRPLIERLLHEQVQEAGWFVSLMGRLVQDYPDWADQVVARSTQIPSSVQQEFRTVVARVRRPDSRAGRPQLLPEPTTSAR